MNCHRLENGLLQAWKEGTYAMYDSKVGQLATDANDDLQVCIKWADNSSSDALAVSDLTLQDQMIWNAAVQQVRSFIQMEHCESVLQVWTAGTFAIHEGRIGELSSNANDILQVQMKLPDNSVTNPLPASDLELSDADTWNLAVQQVCL